MIEGLNSGIKVEESMVEEVQTLQGLGLSKENAWETIVEKYGLGEIAGRILWDMVVAQGNSDLR